MSSGAYDFTGNYLQKHCWYRKDSIINPPCRVLYYLAYSYEKCTAAQGTGER